MSPRTRRLSELHAMMGHTIEMLNAWKACAPYSDLVTRNTLHPENLPCIHCGYLRGQHAFEGGCYVTPDAPFWLRTTMRGTSFTL